MKLFNIAIIGVVLFALSSCGTSKTLGDKVNEPFSSSKYESNNRYFRAVGKGSSSDDNIAKGKADLQAKKELAQQIQTRIKVVSDQYFMDTETENTSEVNDKFQSLIREVTNTQMANLMKIGEEKFIKDDKYTVFIAYEIHKKKMLRYMKKLARADTKLDKAAQKQIEDIIDEELKRLDEIDPEG